jgi:hypothetical protein
MADLASFVGVLLWGLSLLGLLGPYRHCDPKQCYVLKWPQTQCVISQVEEQMLYMKEMENAISENPNVIHTITAWDEKDAEGQQRISEAQFIWLFKDVTKDDRRYIEEVRTEYHQMRDPFVAILEDVQSWYWRTCLSVICILSILLGLLVDFCSKLCRRIINR